ncbi:hypothetical protein BCR39DRAFT_518688 [Naematelia encephala]|uniref:Uncharacterized protein n=1 Tax=Naematelia encephala TaxID=71784 RepID=A0A1Y2BG64_9TREE|nr:hypothetical protein BCR39DRAFT_518688 [Naematelia encephala]
MSLRDTACYTLHLIPSSQDPNIIEAVENLIADAENTARYARVREVREGEIYSAAIYDPLTTARLASIGSATEKSKKRRLQLHGPDEDVVFEFTGKITFEWTFRFEGNKYRWTREVYGKDYICCLDRKPDPKVEICLAREADKNAPARLQILHYNIERFPDEIRDLRGLETLLVSTLMCFIDAADDRSRGGGGLISRPSISASSSTDSARSAQVPQVERVISEEDYEPENPNEILVAIGDDLDRHVARACGLLEDPNVLFIVIRTKTAQASQRALEVSLGVTRYRHREGLGDLHQYVIEEENIKPLPDRPGPKVIKLDDEPQPSLSRTGSKKAWTPPPNIAIYLSTIELPDLKPGRRETLKVTHDQSGKSIPTSTAPIQSPSQVQSEVQVYTKSSGGTIKSLLKMAGKS